MEYLFIHGGPGLNSNPEKNILEPIFCESGHVIHFWNEPSELRGGVESSLNEFESIASSLEDEIRKIATNKKITLIAHSFGAFTLNRILKNIEHLIEQIILIAPVSNLICLDRNILELARRNAATKFDFESIELFEDMLANFKSPFSKERLDSLFAALGREDVLPSYWSNKKMMCVYNSYFNEVHFQIDFKSFASQRHSIQYEQHIIHPSVVPTKIIFGSNDPVVKFEQEVSVLRNRFAHCEFYISKESSHYPHIEATPEFLNFIFDKTDEVLLNL